MLNSSIEMNPDRVTAHKLNNLLQSIMLLAGMAALLGLLGWLLAGIKGVIWAAIIGVVCLLVSPRASPRLVFKLSGARPLSVAEAPALYALVKSLALRARLPTLPQLYYIPTQAMNAFTVGNRQQAMIAVTDGLLRGLTRRELAGVLAHEVSHVDNNDMWVMTLADTVNRLTSLFSLFGQLLFFINLPLVLFGKSGFSWLAILLLVFAPTLSVLLQLALSRTREFDADLGAAQITHDPLGLASALKKLHNYHSGSLRRVLMPGRPIPDPSMLRTHPKLEERIRRLVSLAEREPRTIESFSPIDEDLVVFPPRLSFGPRLPQWFMGWHGH